MLCMPTPKHSVAGIHNINNNIPGNKKHSHKG